MATRSSVKIDGINLYSHWDGYPMGMTQKLYYAIEKQTEDRTKFLNAFIAGNVNNCEIDIEDNTGGLEYAYTINSKDMTIGAYEVDWNTDEKTLIFTGTIFDFIKQYHNASSDRSSIFTDEKIYMTETKSNYNDKVDYRYYTQETFDKTYACLEERVKEFDETNPNKKVYQDKLDVLEYARIFEV